MSQLGRGCVKPCTSRECAELFSFFSSFDGDCQSGSFLIQRNRDKLSTRKFGVRVFTPPGSSTDLTAPNFDFRSSPESGLKSDIAPCPFRADSVAKVFLRHGSQILRGVGAAIDQRCGAPRRHTPNSQAILAAGLRLYRAAIVACFVLWREFSSCGFWDFCNTICQERT